MPSRANADFPSFSEGLSLRHHVGVICISQHLTFPFLFGRAFIEARFGVIVQSFDLDFPSFSEGLSLRPLMSFTLGALPSNFPSFSEGLSLRRFCGEDFYPLHWISLPFRRNFH